MHAYSLAKRICLCLAWIPGIYSVLGWLFFGIASAATWKISHSKGKPGWAQQEAILKHSDENNHEDFRIFSKTDLNWRLCWLVHDWLKRYVTCYYMAAHPITLQLPAWSHYGVLHPFVIKLCHVASQSGAAGWRRGWHVACNRCNET